MSKRFRVSVGGGRLSLALAAPLAGLAVSACGSMMSDPVVSEPAAPRAAATPAAYPVTSLVGRWGIASYREEKDRVRTEAKAREQCKLPYTIAKGPTDGVMMHIADDEKLYELTLKGGPGAKTYLGFDAPPGDPQDREIVSYSENRILMRYVDPDVHNRYGVFIYVRCPR